MVGILQREHGLTTRIGRPPRLTSRQVSSSHASHPPTTMLHKGHPSQAEKWSQRMVIKTETSG
jgi:hypothetical protein